MSNDDSNGQTLHDPNGAMLEPGGEQKGTFDAEAVVFLRRQVVEGKEQVVCLVQYEGEQYVVNPHNPTGDAVPDMSNPAVAFARWIELHLPALVALSMGEFHLRGQLTATLVAHEALKPKLNLLAADGQSKLQ